MSWFSKTLGILLLTAVPSIAAPRLVARPYAMGPRFIVRPYNYYGPAWYGGYWGPQYYPWGYAVGPAVGQIKIDTRLKDAAVYVDGGYVGPVDKFKKFGLKPGNHDIELRDASDHTIFKKRVQVVVDKTIQIKPPA
jgi:hypothetical protein